MLMHSTLEEAWGKQQPNLVKKKNSKECDLYDGRKAKVKKPYKKSAKRPEYRNMMLLNDDDYEQNGMLKPDLEKYHGYTDSRAFSRSMGKKRAPQRKIKVNPVKNTYEEDDSATDDSDVETSLVNDSEFIFEEVYEEDEENYDDNYLTERFKRKELQKKQVMEEQGGIEEEEVNEEMPSFASKVKTLKNVNADMNQVLDLSIYTLSGILLIVILEQFVQLGVKIKSLN